MNKKLAPKKSVKRRLVMDVQPITRRRAQAAKETVRSQANSLAAQVKKAVTPSVKAKKRTSVWQRIVRRELHKHPFVVPVLTFVLLSFFSMAAYVASISSTLGPSDTKLVMLTVDDEQQTLPTRAKNVRELLEKAGIVIGDQDIVEPALDTEIFMGVQTNVTVHKARPITIIDGVREITAVAAGPTPRDAVARAGITIYPEDKLEAYAQTIDTEEVLRGQPVAQRFIINRATPATVSLYGSIIPVRTHVTTVGEVIKEKRIQIQDDDVITPHPDTPLVANAQIFITRVGTSIEAREEEIPMPIETIEDPNLPIGRTIVRQKGSAGRKVVTYQIELQNGQEASRVPIQEIIAVEAITEIIVKGTKPPTIIVAGDHAALMLAAGIPVDQHASAEYIIMRESTWRLDARNAGGCLGLGQACPGSKLVNACPDYANDADCQLRFFTRYVNGRYGSWNGAYNFWVINHWY